MAGNSLSLTIPQEYGYVVVTAASTFFLSFWHGTRVGSFRKAAGIGYPQPYADSAHMSAASPEKKKAMYLFNCAQRAHGEQDSAHTTKLAATCANNEAVQATSSKTTRPSFSPCSSRACSIRSRQRLWVWDGRSADSLMP